MFLRVIRFGEVAHDAFLLAKVATNPALAPVALAQSARARDIDSPGANFVKEVKKDSTCAI